METAERISQTLGLEFVKGGIHPRFGTRNVIFPLQHNQYLEVVEVLDHPASLKAPFGHAVRARSELGGGWMGWCVSLDEMGQAEQRLGRQAVPGNRKFPDGRELTWQQIGIKGLIADPQVPYLLRWDDGTEDLHPSRALDPVGFIDEITIAGSRDRVLEWLGKPDEVQLGEVTMSYQSPNGTPGILSVTFQTPKGEVVL